MLWEFVSEHYKEIALGVLLVFGILGSLRERISRRLRVVRTRQQIRQLQVRLGSLSEGDTEDAVLRAEQEELARLKVSIGKGIGLKELREISYRTRGLSIETRRLLVDLLAQQDPSGSVFDEILDLLCSERTRPA